MKSDSYFYSAYDLTIQSTFELPELIPIAGGDPEVDVEFRRGSVEPVSESVKGVGGRRIRATPEECRLTYESIGSFLVEGGNRVVCDPLSDEVSGREFFKRLLENEILGLILLQRDHLVLHGSAVAVDGRAAIFLGPRGAGKSTTAAAFELGGYSMLEDDVVAIRFDSGVPVVLPGVPQLRLRPDAADALGVTDATVVSQEPWYEKQFLTVDENPGPVRLARCYLLREGTELAFEKVPGPDQILALITHTHARGLLADTEQSSVHFEQCSRVVSDIRIQILKRPIDHQTLPTLVEAVAEDIGSDDHDDRALTGPP